MYWPCLRFQGQHKHITQLALKLKKKKFEVTKPAFQLQEVLRKGVNKMPQFIHYLVPNILEKPQLFRTTSL